MGLCQCRKTTLERVETVDIAKHVVIAVSYLMMSVPSEGQNLSANQISMTYLHSRLRYYYFRFGKQTSAILEFYFRFRSRPFRHQLQCCMTSCISLLNFVQIRAPSAEIYNVISISQDGGRSILLPVSYLLTSPPSEGQSL